MIQSRVQFTFRLCLLIYHNPHQLLLLLCVCVCVQFAFIFWAIFLVITCAIYLFYGMHHTQGEGK